MNAAMTQCNKSLIPVGNYMLQKLPESWEYVTWREKDYTEDFNISCRMKQNMFKLKNVVHYFLGNIHNIQVLYMHKRLTMNNVLKAFLQKEDS